MEMFHELYEGSFHISDTSLFLVSILVVMLMSIVAALLVGVLRLVVPQRAPGTMVATMLTGILLPTGMVVAFVASDVWHNEEKGRAAVETEAGAVGDVLRVARHLSPENRAAVSGLVKQYVDVVSGSEWPTMARGESTSQVDDIIEKMVVIAVSLQARSETGSRDAVAAAELRKYVSHIETARDSRLRIAEVRVRPPKWIAVFMMLFVSACVIAELHFQHKRSLLMSLVYFSFAFGVTVFLIAAYDRPFTGKTIIEPTPLFKALQLQ